MNRYEILRYEHGLTRAELAEKTGLAERTIRYIETDDVKLNAPTAKALADFYDITVSQLLGVGEKTA